MAVQQIHTYCAMCVSQCGVVASVEDGILKNVNIDPDHPNGCICVKGTAAPEIVYSPDRLKYPMVRTRPKGERDPGWVRVSWDEAMELMASRLKDIKNRYGAEAVVLGLGRLPGAAFQTFFMDSVPGQRLRNPQHHGLHTYLQLEQRLRLSIYLWCGHSPARL